MRLMRRGTMVYGILVRTEERAMSDTKSLEEKIDQLMGMCAALSAFVCELPEAKTVEMPKMKAAIAANKALTEAQAKFAVDAARELKHTVQAKHDGH
jgi:hypothetical protein